MDEELFKLCKEVYKRFPEWKTGRHIWSMKRPVICKGDDFMDGMSFPLYTSDYLLDKLQSKKGLAVTKYVEGGWNAHCERKMHGNAKWVDYYEGVADTPLKALLKLTIALSEAGELK